MINSDGFAGLTLIASLISTVNETKDTPIQDVVTAKMKLEIAKPIARQWIKTSWGKIQSIATNYGVYEPY
jgi:hypothetical protein